MIGNLRPASDPEIQRLLANPAEITRFLYGGGSDDSDRVVLNKAWHAIHFALTGSRLGGEEPLNFLVAEGTPVGQVDVGFGPARAMSSEQVRHLAEALASIEPNHIADRLDVRQLDEQAIYPGNWQRNGYGVEYVVSNYREMREFVIRAAKHGHGMILYIN